MMQQISLSIQNFNNKVKQLNQTNSKQVMLSADEARNLHSDIFTLLANIAEIQSKSQSTPQKSSEISLDGGGF
jgi:hypothetical protein